MIKIANIGDRYELLTVIKILPNITVNGRNIRIVECKCVCGNIKSYRVNNLPTTKSCGCLRKQRFLTHGLSHTREYHIWLSMRRRCDTPEDDNYIDYGARGIKVCERWDSSFENFMEDMGIRPSKYLSIERVDNDKGYCPENCIWGTKKQQSRNTRQSVWVIYNGKRELLISLCERFGIKSTVVHSRLWYGWELKEALTTPVSTIRGRKNGSKNKKQIT